MRYMFFVIVYFVFYQANILTAQTAAIQGSVVDAEDKEPLVGVHVFLASTTYGATTNNEGRYQIDDVPPGNYTLIVSMIGYETLKRQVQLDASGRGLDIEFDLVSQRYELEDVEVVDRRDREWERLFERFKREFIGEGPHAVETEILNAEVLDLKVDVKGWLTASASTPLQIVNRSLGYRMTYILDVFRLETHTNILFYKGEVFFEDLPTAQSASSSSIVLSPEFDVKNLKPGSYVVRVEVIDLSNEERVVRTVDVELTK